MFLLYFSMLHWNFYFYFTLFFPFIYTLWLQNCSWLNMSLTMYAILPLIFPITNVPPYPLTLPQHTSRAEILLLCLSFCICLSFFFYFLVGTVFCITNEGVSYILLYLHSTATFCSEDHFKISLSEWSLLYSKYTAPLLVVSQSHFFKEVD